MEKESVVQWLRNSQRRIQRNGLRGAIGATKPVYIKALQQVLPNADGEAIFDYNWDLLVVLDACRYDLLLEASGETDYSFLSDVNKFQSLESATKFWMAQNFTTDYHAEMQRTAYVCGNPFSTEELDAETFALLDEVWKYGWNDELGTLPPRLVTDRTIAAGRTGEAERLIAHYMQPHCPFVGSGYSKQKKSPAEWGHESTRDIWRRLEDGDVKAAQVREAYRANLEYVLEEVALLLNNISAERVVITSDHGNAIGEWGLYGHPAHMPFQCLRTVPWVRTVARDSGTHTPTTEQTHVIEDDETSVTERLEALGYR